MTKEKGKSPSPSSPKATAAQHGQEQSVGPLTQLLIKSRQRIVDPRAFTRGAYARDATGNAVNVLDPGAVAWCAVGTLECEAKRSVPSWEPMPGKPVKSNNLYHTAHDLLEQAAAQLLKTVHTHASEITKERYSITALSDGAGHARALQMYNKAIGLAKGK